MMISVLNYIPAAEHQAIKAGTSTFDCTPYIQQAIDDAIYRQNTAVTLGNEKVRLPGGKYCTYDTIHLGYGDTFHSVVLEGDGYVYRHANQFNGALIETQFNDRPAVAVQGARGTAIRGISVANEDYAAFIAQEKLATPGCPIDDTDPANWHDPNGNANQDSTHAPFCGIAIDPYSGNRPTVSYPDVNYPSFLPQTQYGKSQSSHVVIENCFIRGFPVGVVVQPGDFDAQADYVKVRECRIEYCKWGISAGNSQGRCTGIQDNIFAFMYTCLTNRTHGKKRGQFAGTVSNNAVELAIQFVDFREHYAQPITFTNNYLENIWKIGYIQFSSSNEKGYIFDACEFGFHLQDDIRGHPARVIDGGAVGDFWPIHFRVCNFREFKSVCGLSTGPTLDDCSFESEGRTELYEKYAHNVLTGGVVTPFFRKGTRNVLKSRRYNLDTGNLEGAIGTTSDYKLTRRVHCIPVMADNVSAQGIKRDNLLLPYGRILPYNKSSTTCTLNGREMTMVCHTSIDWFFMVNGLEPGDVIWDQDGGSVFFIKSRVGDTITAELQNNYRINQGSSAVEYIVPISVTGSYWYCLNSRTYTPKYCLYASGVEGERTFTEVGRENGTDGEFSSEIHVGDYMHVDMELDRFLDYYQSANVVSMDSTARTIEVGSTIRRGGERRLDYFIRTPPANI